MADARALLQQRVALFFLVQLAIGGVAYAERLIRGAVYYRGGLPAMFATDPGQMFGHGSFVLLYALAWAFWKLPAAG